MDLVERQAEPFCGCGDQIVPDTGARCGTCASLRDDEIERLQNENAGLRAERDHARLCYGRAVRILTGIHALLYPPRFTDHDGRTWQFKSPLAEEQMQELSDRIRALPDEIAAIDAAMQKGE